MKQSGVQLTEPEKRIEEKVYTRVIMAKWLWVCDDLLSEEECSRMIEHFKE